MKKDKLSKILMILGLSLVVLSLGTLLITHFSQRSAASRARQLVVELRQLMPATHNGVMDDRVNVVMSSMELNGESFCGIIEIPAFNTDLPICDNWRSALLSRYPCRYTGSIYDRSLVIGGSDSSGQFDFMKEIVGGDRIYVTDMTGARYSYYVSDVHRVKEVNVDSLSDVDGDLVFYAKSSYSFDYTLVICKLG